MRFLAAALTVATLALNGCASVPISTMLALAALSPRSVAQIDPQLVRVRISVPVGFELNVAASRLTFNLEMPGGSRFAALDLAQLGVARDTRPGGMFSPDVAVTTYLLALTPEGARKMRELQGFAMSSEPKELQVSVQVTFREMPREAREVFFWADLKWQADQPFMPLIDRAKIKLV